MQEVFAAFTPSFCLDGRKLLHLTDGIELLAAEDPTKLGGMPPQESSACLEGIHSF